MAFLKRISIVIFIIIFLGCQPEISQNSEPEDNQCRHEFVPETQGFEDRLVFQYIPKKSHTTDYFISYTIQQDKNFIVNEKKEKVESVNQEHPIQVSVYREPQSEYIMNMEIRDFNGKNCLYQGKIGIQKAP